MYTSPEITSPPLYASNFTYLFCVLLYSIGCPLMYVLGAMFFTVQYWWYKYLLLNYHQKASKFSDQLPINSTDYIKIGLFMHVAMAYLLLTDDNLLPTTDTVLSYETDAAGAQA